MRRNASQPLLGHFLEANNEEEVAEEGGGGLDFRINSKLTQDFDFMAQITCIAFPRRDPKKPTSLSSEKYGSWKQEQKAGAARLKKQLKSRWAIPKLINAQLAQFEAHYNRALAPKRMSDVTQLLMPKWIPAHELAAVSWLGDWRPSTMLELLRSMSHLLWDRVGAEHALSQLIHDVQIEEAVIDAEMIEIQSNCILHLPFRPVKGNGTRSPLAPLMSEFKKIHRVIVKAQNLRMKTLEWAVKKVLSQTDAAEFLVAFVGIQDVLHEFSVKYRARNGPVCIKLPGVPSLGKLEQRPYS